MLKPALMRVENIANEALTSLWDVSINSQHICNAIAPPIRGAGIKVYGETAISAGMYDCFIRKSPTKGRGKVIELKGVENYKYIQFHVGNFFWDSDGCFCVGKNPTLMNVGIQAPDWFQKFVPEDFKLSSHKVSDSRETQAELLKAFKFKKVEKCHVVI